MSQTVYDSTGCKLPFEPPSQKNQHGALGGKASLNNMIHHKEHEFTCNVLYPCVLTRAPTHYGSDAGSGTPKLAFTVQSLLVRRACGK